MQELPVINRTQELYHAVSKLTERLPSLQKQTVGRRSEDAILELMEVLVMAKHAPHAHKGAYLLKATALVEIVLFHVRSLLEQKLVNETLLYQLQAKILEIGRMIGGWYKSVK